MSKYHSLRSSYSKLSLNAGGSVVSAGLWSTTVFLLTFICFTVTEVNHVGVSVIENHKFHTVTDSVDTRPSSGSSTVTVRIPTPILDDVWYIQNHFSPDLTLPDGYQPLFHSQFMVSTTSTMPSPNIDWIWNDRSSMEYSCNCGSDYYLTLLMDMSVYLSLVMMLCFLTLTGILFTLRVIGPITVQCFLQTFRKKKHKWHRNTIRFITGSFEYCLSCVVDPLVFFVSQITQRNLSILVLVLHFQTMFAIDLSMFDSSVGNLSLVILVIWNFMLTSLITPLNRPTLEYMVNRFIHSIVNLVLRIVDLIVSKCTTPNLTLLLFTLHIQPVFGMDMTQMTASIGKLSIVLPILGSSLFVLWTNGSNRHVFAFKDKYFTARSVSSITNLTDKSMARVVRLLDLNRSTRNVECEITVPGQDPVIERFELDKKQFDLLPNAVELVETLKKQFNAENALNALKTLNSRQDHSESGRDQSGRDRSGRDQSGRDQSGRDQSGRVQSGRDRSGRDQSLASTISKEELEQQIENENWPTPVNSQVIHARAYYHRL